MMKNIFLTTLLSLIIIGSLKAQIGISEFSVAAQYLQGQDILLSSSPNPTKVEFKIRISGPNNIPFIGSVDIVYRTANQPAEVLSAYSISNNSFGTSGVLALTREVNLESTRTNGKIEMRVSWKDGKSGALSEAYASNGFWCVKKTVTPPPPLASNTISLVGNPNFMDDFSVNGSQPTGGVGNYTYAWKIIDDNDVEVTGLKGVSSSMNSWNKNNTEYLPTFVTKNIYVQRIITSGSKTLASNKVLVNNWNGTNKTVTAKIETGDLAKCIGLAPESFTSVNGAGVDLNVLCNYIEGVPKEVNSLFLKPGYYNFQINNPAMNVNYKWYLMLEDEYIYNRGDIGDTSFVYGNLVNVLIPPVYGWNKTSRMYIFGSDGSLTVIPLPEVNIM